MGRPGLETFTQDGAWRIPYVNVEFVSREEIRAGIERLQGFWDLFVQTTHPGTIEFAGGTAVGRASVAEFGRFRDGRSQLHYSGRRSVRSDSLEEPQMMPDNLGLDTVEL